MTRPGTQRDAARPGTAPALPASVGSVSSTSGGLATGAATATRHPTGAPSAGTDAVAGRPDWPVVIAGVLLLGLAGLVAYEGWRVSTRPVLYGLAPGTVPYVVGAGLAVLALLVLVQGLRGAFPPRDRDVPGPILWIVGGLVAQIALLSAAGFSVATGLVFAATARAMGRGPLWATVPAGMVFCFVIWVAFTQLLNLSLPAGPIERAFLDLISPAPSAPAPGG